MINLLPYEKKRQMKAARHNIILVKCLMFLISAVIFLSLAYFYSQSIVDQYAKNLKLDINTSDEEAIKQSIVITSTLINIESLINNNLKYSDIIFDISNNLPDGVILADLTINQDLIQSGLSLIVFAKNKSGISLLKTNLSKSKIFSSVSVSEASDSDRDDYPQSANVMIKIKGVNE